MRILNLDLDFFVEGVAYYRGRDDARLSPDEYASWHLDDALGFLEQRCLLSGKLPGFVVEHQGDVFPLWRKAIAKGLIATPFHLTHVDAHADLGLGDGGYVYVCTSLLHKPVGQRPELDPDLGGYGLGDGNFLAFAAACRWISSLDYVYNEGGGNDVPLVYMEDFKSDARNLLLRAMDRESLTNLIPTYDTKRISIDHVEPAIPFGQYPWREYQAAEGFDFICLARSPSFTPVSCDVIFDEIRARFIAEVNQQELR